MTNDLRQARSESRRAHAAYRTALAAGVTGEALAALDRAAGEATAEVQEILAEARRFGSL
jgi:hypothetical protein